MRLETGDLMNMPLSPCEAPRTPRYRSGAVSLLAAGSILHAACLTVLPPAAHATDMAVVETNAGQQQSGRFLRLGLSKSAVIKLPGEAKDVIVGDSGIVDVVLRQRNKAYFFARAAGQTNIFFFDANGQEILHLDVEVALDSKALKQLLDRSIPGNSIQIDTTGSNVVLKGTVANATEAKMAEDLANRFAAGSTGANAPVLNLLKIAQGSQVTLKVSVVELKRTVLKQLGINLSGNLEAGSLNFSFSNRASSIDSSVLTGVGNMLSGGQSLTVRIEALEEQGLAKTLAEPTLTATSGAPATFFAGGEFPYRECDLEEGATTEFCDIQFKPFGVSLAFTPTVLDENRIALNIATEVSELVDRTLGLPALDTRKAQTSVEIPSGGSMMMAGLIKDVSTQKLRGTPGLRTLPVLGALFSSRDYQQNQSELVVIVTPYIAQPVDQEKLATPVDGFNEPTDLQQIFLNRLNRVYGLPGDRPSGVYHGKVGHIVE